MTPPTRQPPAARPGFFAKLSRSARVGEVGVLSPWALARFRDGLLGRLFQAAFRPRVSGWERLPSDRPFLLVANHSGGGGPDVAVMLKVWADRFDGTRRLTALTHPLAFHLPITRSLLFEVGAIPSSYDAALAALEQGVGVLVFPGGDQEAFRPLWKAKQVDFRGRQGFLRIARHARVPVIPMGIHGTHYTAPIVWRSRLAALLGPRLLGLKQIPLTVSGLAGAAGLTTLLQGPLGLPAAAAIGWAWLISPFAILMPYVPWSVRIEIGEPLEPEQLFGDRDADGPLDDALARVQAEVQRLVLSAAGS